jgi:hypothetical protein
MTAPSARNLVAATEVALRALAATVGAYSVAYAATGVMALLLPTDHVQAAIIATNLSFLLFPVLSLWSFCHRNVWQVWAGMLAITATLGVLWEAISP